MPERKRRSDPSRRNNPRPHELRLIGGPHFHQIIKKRRAATHIGQGRRGRAVDVGGTPRKLVPVDSGGHSHTRANAAAGADPRQKSSSVIVHLGPLASLEPRFSASSTASSTSGSPAAVRWCAELANVELRNCGRGGLTSCSGYFAARSGARAGLRVAACTQATGQIHRPSSALSKARISRTASEKRLQQRERSSLED